MTRTPTRSTIAAPASFIESTATAGSVAASLPSPADIFLSPRVVDQGAFEEFAGKLRLLVDRVAAEAGGVSNAIESARSTASALRESESRQREQFDLAGRVLKALAVKTDEVRALLERTTGAEEIEKRLQEQTARLLDQRVQEIVQRLTQTAERAAADVETRLHERRAVWAAEIDRMDHAVRDSCAAAMSHLKAASDKVSDLCARADRLSGEGAQAAGVMSLADLVRKAESVSAGVDSMLQRLSAVRSEADTSLAGLSRSASAAREMLNAITTRQESLSTETRRSAEACDQLASRLAHAQGEARLLTESISMSRERANSAAEQLKGLVQAAEAAGVSTTVSELRDMLRFTDAAIKKLEPWRSLVETAGRDDQLPEPIARLVGTIRNEICADLSEMARALSSVSERAGRVALREAAGGSAAISGSESQIGFEGAAVSGSAFDAQGSAGAD